MEPAFPGAAPRLKRGLRGEDWAWLNSPTGKLQSKLQKGWLSFSSTLTPVNYPRSSAAWSRTSQIFDRFRRSSPSAQTGAMLLGFVLLAALASTPYTRGSHFGIHRSTLLHTWSEEHAYAWWERQQPFLVGERRGTSLQNPLSQSVAGFLPQLPRTILRRPLRVSMLKPTPLRRSQLHPLIGNQSTRDVAGDFTGPCMPARSTDYHHILLLSPVTSR